MHRATWLLLTAEVQRRTKYLIVIEEPASPHLTLLTNVELNKMVTYKCRFCAACLRAIAVPKSIKVMLYESAK